jgi:hypothetical protein
MAIVRAQRGIERDMKSVGAVLIAGLSTGCATTLSSMQTAVPVEPGHVQVTGGYGIFLPLGPLGIAAGEAVHQLANSIDAAKNGTKYMLTEDDKQHLITAGVGIGAMPPGPAYELSVRTGITYDWDAGVKWSSTGSLKLDSKIRLGHFERKGGARGLFSPSFDIAIGFGGGKTLIVNPVIDALQFVRMGNFDRWDVEVPVYLSLTWGEFLRFWVVPKYVFSHTTMDANLVQSSMDVSGIIGDVSVPESVDTQFFGASIGFGAGYKWVHLMLELTMGYTYCRPEVLGQVRDLGGPTLYPAIGLEVKI